MENKINLPICRMCEHFVIGLRDKYTCKAFEDIPDEILIGDNDHSEPLEGQENDVVFEPIDTDFE